MKIEIGIQPNCSELEVHLDAKPNELSKIKRILKDILDITNWRLAGRSDFYSPLPAWFSKEDLDNHLAIVRSDDDCYDFKQIYGYNKKKTVLKQKYPWKNCGLFLVNPDATDYLHFGFGNGYDREDELALNAQQHGCSGEFEPLAKVIRAMNLTWHCHDGGDSWNFGHWCVTHGYEDVAKMYEDGDQEEFHQCDDTSCYSSKDGRVVVLKCFVCGEEVTDDEGKNPRRSTFWSKQTDYSKITIDKKEQWLKEMKNS